jgi:hypothetical protein
MTFLFRVRVVRCVERFIELDLISFIVVDVDLGQPPCYKHHVPVSTNRFVLFGPIAGISWNPGRKHRNHFAVNLDIQNGRQQAVQGFG